jgi:hypothetical protein
MADGVSISVCDFKGELQRLAQLHCKQASIKELLDYRKIESMDVWMCWDEN